MCVFLPRTSDPKLMRFQVKPFANGMNGPISSAVLLPDTTDLEDLARSRLEQLESLRAEQTALLQENDRLRLLVSYSPKKPQYEV